MKRFLLTLIMAFSFFGLFGRSDKFRTVGVKDFAEALSDTSYVLLDVRTAGEHAQGHIPGTDYNIDILKDDYTAVATSVLPSDRPVALYCRSGNRSKKAARILAENGYEVIELGSGISGWISAGKPVVKK